MSLTPEAKKLLAETIRGTAQSPEKGLRARLLRGIQDEADRRYRLSVPIEKAGLDEAHHQRRARIEAWVDERARSAHGKRDKSGAPQNKAELAEAKERLLLQAEKDAAATLLNRLVLLRLLEARNLSKPHVLTGGWNSKGYREFRGFAPTLCINGTSDETEGYATLLQLVFDELASDLPGLYGDVGLSRLFPAPPAVLRHVVETLDQEALASAWTDDTTLGWVYQYWNDPDREALDAKINDGGKIEPHEIASKTQMFTERYMVEWLLQNSLGLTWLAMCKKHGWTADAERVLPALDARRAGWRAKRDAGDVALDTLMPIDGALEEHWKYYVPQAIPDDAVDKAPASVRALKILDPACGSGHFLVIAFDLLAALYREEARHLGRPIGEQQIAQAILEDNLYGIDIDPRAIQIAAAGLYLKAKTLSKAARPKKLNLVAPVLQLGNLPADDPAVVALRRELKQEAGIPEELTTKLLSSLAGVDYLGSLLKVDAAIDEAIKDVELSFVDERGQGNLFNGFPSKEVQVSAREAKATIVGKLEGFLAKHSKSEDLGLRLDGEQLAAGVRFVRIAKEDTYDVVVGNPPYQGLTKTASFEYVAKTYPKGKADLYAAFLERGLQFARVGGALGMVTMQGWMFLGQYAELRKSLLTEHDLRSLADLMWCAFENMRHATVAMAVVLRGTRATVESVAVAPTARAEREESIPALARKRAALLAHVGRHEFDPRGFEVIEGEPIVYWWSKEFLEDYGRLPKFGQLHPARQGLGTRNDVRFLRQWWEVARDRLFVPRADRQSLPRDSVWVPYIKGAAGQQWFEPLEFVIEWATWGLQLQLWIELYRLRAPGQYIKNESFYFRRGIAFTTIGASFGARVHRFPSIFGEAGSSVFPDDLAAVLCAMNARRARLVL